MTSNALQHREPAKPRTLGVKDRPSMRLALGYRDPEKRGAPVKTDYFVAPDGPEGRYARAAAKFRDVYGDKPRAIEILLFPELHRALDVRYKAWASSGEGGGVLKAWGDTNQAMLGEMGVPDTLNVFTDGGTIDQVEITGPDDPVCVELGIADPKSGRMMIETRFRFNIPKVLGFGSWCEITTKSAQSTDSLFAKLVQLYGVFGSAVQIAVEPVLVLVPATGRAQVVNRQSGEVRWQKTSFYALDLRTSETVDEMFQRLSQRNALLPGGARAALYGNGRPAAAALPPAGGDEYPYTDFADDADDAEPVEGVIVEQSPAAAPAPAGDGSAGEGGGRPAAAPTTTSGDEGWLDEDERFDQARAAGETVLKSGKYQGQTIRQVSETDAGYVTYIGRADSRSPHRAAAALFASVFLTGAEQ